MPSCPICKDEIDYFNKSEIGTCSKCATPTLQKIEELSETIKTSVEKANTSSSSQVRFDSIKMARSLFQEIESMHNMGVRGFEYSADLEHELYKNEQKILLEEVDKIYLEVRGALATLGSAQEQSNATQNAIERIQGFFEDNDAPYPRRVNKILKQLSLFADNVIVKDMLQEAEALKENNEEEAACEKFKEALSCIRQDKINDEKLSSTITAIKAKIIDLGGDPETPPKGTTHKSKLSPPVKNTNPINAFLPLDNLVAVDCKTTGINPGSDRIIEIGAIKFALDGEVGAKVESFANPGFPIPSTASAFNKITDPMVALSPSPERVARNLVRWIGPDAILFMHYANFYADFLIFTLGMANVEIPKGWYIIDTLKWSRERYQSTDYQLETLIRELNLAIPRSNSALDDAKTVAALYGELAYENQYLQEDLSSHAVRMHALGEEAISQEQKMYLLRKGVADNILSKLSRYQAGNVVAQLEQVDMQSKERPE